MTLHQSKRTVPALEETRGKRAYGIRGQWISPDPGGIASVDPTDPQTWNRYAYVRNSPTSMVDPTGLDGEGGAVLEGSAGIVAISARRPLYPWRKVRRTPPVIHLSQFRARESTGSISSSAQPAPAAPSAIPASSITDRSRQSRAASQRTDAPSSASIQRPPPTVITRAERSNLAQLVPKRMCRQRLLVALEPGNYRLPTL